MLSVRYHNSLSRNTIYKHYGKSYLQVLKMLVFLHRLSCITKHTIYRVLDGRPTVLHGCLDCSKGLITMISTGPRLILRI